MVHDDDLLVYAHIGDLHLTSEDEQNYRDLAAIVDELSGPLKDAFDFVYLPGDNADNGLPAQYELVRRQLDRLPMPVHVITGDHDMEPGGLDNFYAAGHARLPMAVGVGALRCLFLDICGPGRGGPDFRLGAAQSDWLRSQLESASACRQDCAVFMHSYPQDLKGDGETDAINNVLAAREVLLVDMGHTHYNEIANDGRTIFTATRSTGQIEEGPVGYSIVTIDRRTISWRFRRLGDSLPIVLITTPTDRRLATDSEDKSHWPHGECEVRVRVLGAEPTSGCRCGFEGHAMRPMRETGGGRYSVTLPIPDDTRKLVVEAEDSTGAIGREWIELATQEDLATHRHADGSDADAIEAWEERGIFGTQLGPNRNGRKW